MRRVGNTRAEELNWQRDTVTFTLGPSESEGRWLVRPRLWEEDANCSQKASQLQQYRKTAGMRTEEKVPISEARSSKEPRAGGLIWPAVEKTKNKVKEQVGLQGTGTAQEVTPFFRL